MARLGEGEIEGVAVAEMREYLADVDVEFAVLFGSRSRGAADADSDVDIALRFPDALDDRERFRLRNRIDADLQGYADGFVEVNDVETLPLPVAHAALRDGVRIAGDARTVDTYRGRIEREYEDSAEERRREHQEFVRRLAEGDV